MILTEEQASALAAWANAETTGVGPAFTAAFEVAKDVAANWSPRQTKEEAENVLRQFLREPVEKGILALVQSDEDVCCVCWEPSGTWTVDLGKHRMKLCDMHGECDSLTTETVLKSLRDRVLGITEEQTDD